MAKRKRNPKNPSSLVFWNDLENDEKLGTCSLAAKGLWTCHLLAIAARSPEPGVIIVGGWPCRVDGDLPMVLANKVGGSPDTIGALLAELVNSGAASIDDAGRLYNRRMVREAKIRTDRERAGAAGGRAAQEKKRRAEQKVEQTPKQTRSKRGTKRASKAPSKRASKTEGREPSQNVDATAENRHGGEELAEQTASKTASSTASKIQPSSCFLLPASEEDSVSSKEETGLRPSTDLASQIFGQGLQWLAMQSGRSDRECRSLMGKWRKQVGDAELIAVIGRAQREGAIEPVAWIEKAIGQRQSPKAPKDLVQDDIDFVDRMRLQEAGHGE